MADHGDDYVCLSDDDGLEHIDSLLESKYTAKDMGTLGFENSDVKSLRLLDRVFRVGVDHTGQNLDVEHDLRHVHSLSVNRDAMRTPKRWAQHERNFRKNWCLDGRPNWCLDGRRSPILKKDEATRNRFAWKRHSYLAQDRLDLAETAQHLAQRKSEPLEFDFNPLKRASRYLVGKPTAALRFRRQKQLTRSESSWTATLLATQSRRKSGSDR